MLISGNSDECVRLLLQAFSSLLKRDVSLNFKSKGNPLVSVLACNILMEAFSEEKHWPDAFVKVSSVTSSIMSRILVHNRTFNIIVAVLAQAACFL